MSGLGNFCGEPRYREAMYSRHSRSLTERDPRSALALVALSTQEAASRPGRSSQPLDKRSKPKDVEFTTFSS